MIIEKVVIIETSIDKAWQILGPEFAYPQRWASAVNHSEAKGPSFEGASCSERGCATTIGQLKEKLIEYDPAQYTLAYEISEGMPGMVSSALNHWQLRAINVQQTQLTMRIEMEVKGILGKIMQPMMRIQMSNLGAQIAEEFKYYVENGKPHPRKVKALQKQSGLKTLKAAA